MKIIVTGANGLLGQHLISELAFKHHEILALGRGECRLPDSLAGNWKYKTCDIRNKEELMETVREFGHFDTFIHAAAETQVDECENNKERCKETNITGTYNCISICKDSKAHFIFISTDFVFNGKKGIYNETDSREPVNYYGQTKLEGEDLVIKSSLEYTIIRTCLVYGNALNGTRSNIMTWTKQNLEQGKNIKVVSDQIRTPTYIGDLVKGVELCMQQKAGGIYHISGKDILTPYEMAILAADYFQLDASLIEKVDASVFTQPGERPLKTGFDISKACTELGYAPISFIDGMKKMYPINFS